MSRPQSRSVRTLVRTSLRSRLEHDYLGRAYELALPMLQARVAEVSARQARPKLPLFSVPQQRLGA
jgi:hypothetical protein